MASGGMPTREQMIADLQTKQPSREQMIADLKSPESSWMDASVDTPLGKISPRGVAQGALNTLPYVGMAAGAIGGGLIGAPAGPAGAAVGGVAGAAAGGAAGESLKSSIESSLGGGPKSREEFYDNIAEKAKVGAESEMTGSLLTAGAKKVAAKGLQMITGIHAQDIKTYAKDAAKINEMAADANGNVAEAANSSKRRFTDSIDTKRGEMNSQISKALENSDARVSGTDIIMTLRKSASQIDRDLHPEQISQVEELIDGVRKKLDENGQIFVSDANVVKKYLQDQASESYRKPGEALLGDQAAQAAKRGAAVTRAMINREVPQVAKANEVLAGFHELEDSLNQNLLEQGKSYAGLIAAGRGKTPQGLTNAENLKKLGELTGMDIVGEAKRLSAMDTFMGPNASKAGRGSVPGALLGGGAGALAGPGASSASAAGGYYLGGAITSPQAVKGMIDVTSPAIEAAGQFPGGQNVLGQSVVRGSQGVKAIMSNQP